MGVPKIVPKRDQKFKSTIQSIGSRSIQCEDSHRSKNRAMVSDQLMRHALKKESKKNGSTAAK